LVVIRNKKILQVLPHLDAGGVPQGCIDIAQAIQEAHGQAYVASAGGPRRAELIEVGGIHLTLPLATKNPLHIWQNAFRLAKVVRQHGIQLIHARSRAPAWSALWAARMTRVPFVTTFHGAYNFSNSVKKYYNSVMVRGDIVIAISHFIEESIRQDYPEYCNSQNIRLVPRGIKLDFFSPEKLRSDQIMALRHRWGLQQGQTLILMPGRLTRWKGQKVLLEALRLLPRGSFKCIFVGSSQGRYAYRKELEAFIEAHHLEREIIFEEHFTDMPLAYAAADGVVHASTDPEAFGRVIAEAQAMGKPVIASNLGAPREILIPGETGWLFSPSAPEQLAKHLYQLKNLSQAERDCLSRKARAHIRTHFSVEQMAQKTLQIYHELLTTTHNVTPIVKSHPLIKQSDIKQRDNS
jgi:glycosyltransferase involved in cell wall biosynthesis